MALQQPHTEKKKVFTLSAEPDGRAYIWASRISWCIGIFTALILFTLIPRWYIALPVALFGCWVTTSLCGLLWYHLREVLICGDRLHKTLSALILAVAISVGVIGFCLVPNWSDFEFNDHPSLVAVAGSVALGTVSFVVCSGMVALVATIVLQFFHRAGHKTQ